MNIVFVIHDLTGLGGTVRVANLLANELSQHHQVTLLSRQGGDNAFDLADAVHDIKFAGSSLSFIRQVRQYVQLEQPDVVIIHTMGKLTPTLLLGGLKAKQLWSLEHIAFEFHSPIWQALRRWLYARLDKVVCLTEADAVHYLPFHPHVSVVPNASPLPIKSTLSGADSKTIVTVGRLTKQKGYDLLIAAWATLESAHPDWQLHIYGDGEDKTTLSQAIAENNLSRIQLKGNTTDVMAVYDDAAFYVMSSRHEGLPVVLIEAQSRGLPIISFDCPSGPAEIISDGKDGFLVENGNTHQLAAKMAELMGNSSMRAKFSEQALLSAHRFAPDSIIRKWLGLLDTE